MEGQVVGSGEAALADFAPERLGTRVLPVVTGQFVGSGETPLTLRPVAPVRLLTWEWPRKEKKKMNGLAIWRDRLTPLLLRWAWGPA